mgnify:CR=1 FL=1
MRQITLKSNGKLVSEKQVKSSFSLDECLVKISHAGICSSDIFRGFQGWAYSYPLVMGHELSGVVEKVGGEVKSFLPGDRVAVFPLRPCFLCDQCMLNEYARCNNYSYYGSREDGGFCDKLAVNEWNLIKIPDGVDLIDACLIEPMSVVIHALKNFKNTEQLSGHMVILGAGFLGTLATKVIQKLYPKLYISVVDRNQKKFDAIDIDSSRKFLCVNDTDWNELITLKNSLFDYVLETTGAPNNISSSIKLCKAGGEIVLLGNVTADHMLEKNTISSILRKEIKIIGSWNSRYKSADDDWAKALELMSAGVNPSHLISHQIQMADIPHYLKKMFDHKMRTNEFEFTKIVAGND